MIDWEKGGRRGERGGWEKGKEKRGGRVDWRDEES